MSLAERFAEDRHALLSDSMYAGHQMVACMDDSAEVIFADGSMASCLNGGPWLPMSLDAQGQLDAEIEAEARTEGLFTPAEDETPDYVGWPEGWREVEA